MDQNYSFVLFKTNVLTTQASSRIKRVLILANLIIIIDYKI